MKTNLTPKLNMQRPDHKNQYPLRIRSIVKGVVAYHPTGIMLFTNQLVITKVKVNIRGKEVEKVAKIEIDNHPNKDFLNRILKEKINTVDKEFMEAEIIGEAGVKQKKGAAIKFSDYAELFIKKEVRDRSEKTWKCTEAMVKKFNRFKPDVLIKNITTDMMLNFEHYCKTKKMKPNKPNTVWLSTRIIKKILKAAKNDVLIDKVPMGMGDKQGVKYKDPIRETMSLDEIEKLEKFVSEPNIKREDFIVISWFIFSCYSGLRYGDMARFAGFDNGNIYLKSFKNNELVSFATTPNIVKAYERINNIILDNKKTNRILKKVMKKLGIKKHISFHNARHTFAVTYLRKGGRLEYLQELMGHKDIATTAIYAKISNNDANAELQRIWAN